MADISVSARARRTPFSNGVEAAGVKGYTVYNQMLLSTVFDSVAADCVYLKRYVQVWDVPCERQVSLKGPDALRLISPRDMGRMADDQCYYMPVADHRGGMLSDPVALGLDVDIDEPDVSPLAVQEPLADDLMARSDWSKQGGFGIYVDGDQYGIPLWQALFAAGEDLKVRAGCPNNIGRIESGLLSYGSDKTRKNTPCEAGLGRFGNSLDDFIGKSALAGVAQNGRHARSGRCMSKARSAAVWRPGRSMRRGAKGGRWPRPFGRLNLRQMWRLAW